MDAVIRAVVMYAFLLIVFRISGKRTLAQMTPFDFILLLVIGEATQQALLGDDFSVTNAFIVITALLATDLGLAIMKQRFGLLGKITEGVPVLIVENGEIIADRADKARIDEEDILQAARQTQGLETMDQIKYAVLERSGGISIIPERSGR